MADMDLNPRVTATLDRLSEAAWFSSCGHPVKSEVIVLSSWADAASSCASDVWQDLLLENSNHLSEAVARASRDRFRSWNSFVERVKPVVSQMIARKVPEAVQEVALPKIVYDTISWDMLHVLLEAEYADLVAPRFFAAQAYWYVAGHFPCGWSATPPEGTLVIY